MKRSILPLLLFLSLVSLGQKPKTDTILGVVVYTAPADLIHISKGNYHTYTVEATEVVADTGVISIRTDLGYIDLRRNYQFIPMNKLQPARLKKKP